MVGWYHRLNGHEFEQALGDGEGQGSLEHCGPWCHKETDTTWRLNNITAELNDWTLCELGASVMNNEVFTSIGTNPT